MLIMIATLTMLSGCSKGEQDKRLPGALTKPIDSYSYEELRDFVKQLTFTGGHERDRRCKGSPDCDGAAPTKMTKVFVDAVATQDSLSATTLPPFGVIAVRALNKGTATEARYGFGAGNHLEYFMIVQRDSASGAASWRLEQLDSRANTHTRVGAGTVAGCGHLWTAGARADFKSCASAAQSDSVAKMGLLLYQGVNDNPLWMTCSQGCCTFN